MKALGDRSISSFLKNPSLRLRDEYVYVKGGEVHGIRKGDWVYLPKTGNSKFKKGDPSPREVKDAPFSHSSRF